MITKRTNQTDEGFTLIELLTVTLIIGILAAIVIPIWYNQRAKAAAADAISDLRNAATFEEAHFAEGGAYSADLSTLTADGFARTPNVPLGIAVSADGYCEVAQAGRSYLWFDSGAGGVQHARTTTLAPPASARGVCASAAPTAVS